jgi:hypothetical protein
VTCFLGLLIYYVPSILKGLELSPRRYAQIMTDELPKQQRHEETEIFQNISALLNAEEQEVDGENLSDDAASWPGRLEDMTRSQHSPAPHIQIQQSDKSDQEATKEAMKS